MWFGVVLKWFGVFPQSLVLFQNFAGIWDELSNELNKDLGDPTDLITEGDVFYPFTFATGCQNV